MTHAVLLLVGVVQAGYRRRVVRLLVDALRPPLDYHDRLAALAVDGEARVGRVRRAFGGAPPSSTE